MIAKQYQQSKETLEEFQRVQQLEVRVIQDATRRLENLHHNNATTSTSSTNLAFSALQNDKDGDRHQRRPRRNKNQEESEAVQDYKKRVKQIIQETDTRIQQHRRYLQDKFARVRNASKDFDRKLVDEYEWLRKRYETKRDALQKDDSFQSILSDIQKQGGFFTPWTKGMIRLMNGETLTEEWIPHTNRYYRKQQQQDYQAKHKRRRDTTKSVAVAVTDSSSSVIIATEEQRLGKLNEQVYMKTAMDVLVKAHQDLKVLERSIRTSTRKRGNSSSVTSNKQNHNDDVGKSGHVATTATEADQQQAETERQLVLVQEYQDLRYKTDKVIQEVNHYVEKRQEAWREYIAVIEVERNSSGSNNKSSGGDEQSSSLFQKACAEYKEMRVRILSSISKRPSFREGGGEATPSDDDGWMKSISWW